MASILQSSIGLMRSRLSRRIVSGVFFSIIVIEAIIFVPSFYRRYREELGELQELSTEVLLTAKANTMAEGDPSKVLTMVQQNLRPDSIILGAMLCTPEGQIIDAFGELPSLDCTTVRENQVQKQVTQNRQRYDVAWPADRFNGEYVLIVRHDATRVIGKMGQYALAIAALVIIISIFVTVVTVWMLERILIIPILRLRDDLREAGDAVSRDETPHFQTQAMHRNDELGEVSQAFCDMFERVHQEILDRKEAEVALKTEQARSEKLLLNILPDTIAEQLKQEVGAIASRFESATILFADIVDFTGLSQELSPSELVTILNDIFSTFDGIAEDLGLEKIKTIGDAYMVVGGLPNPRSDHAQAIVAMAIKMLDTIHQFHRSDGKPFQLRIGINTGPVVAGVIGIKKFSYDLWGDAVNIASRMESHGVENRIQVSESTYQRLRHDYTFEDRGLVNIKGRGRMRTYLLRSTEPTQTTANAEVRQQPEAS
jgi:class 3 adenylate cyclase